MSKSPDCPRCRNHFVVTRDSTWHDLLKIWRAERLQPKKTKIPRGRPLDPNSPLAKIANDLVREEVTKVTAKTKALRAAAINRWASSPNTVNDLTTKLESKLLDKDPTDSTVKTSIRRAVKLALIGVKVGVRALTDEDLKLLRERQLTTVSKLEHLMRDTAAVVQLMINARDNPTSQEALTTAIREAERLTARIQRAKTVSR